VGQEVVYGVGAWRSLVAHSLGVRVVGRSNRLAPTIIQNRAGVSGIETLSSNPIVFPSHSDSRAWWLPVGSAVHSLRRCKRT
jgi:hypothetical protein